MIRSLKDRWAELAPERRSQLLQGDDASHAEVPVDEPPAMMMLGALGMAAFEEAAPESDPFDGIVIVDPHDSNPNVRGPCCRRAKALDNLLDLTPIPVEIRGPMLAQAGFPLLDAICGTCIGRFMRAGGKRSDLYEALGAPAELVQKFRSVE